MSRILPLPLETVRQIHSSKDITSLQDVVISLLENSLDAGATKVEIVVDFPRGGCVVEDNGQGIPAVELGTDGGLGKLYHTSKLPDSSHDEVHGKNGVFLASLASLSLLALTSQHTDCQRHAAVTMHQGKVIARQDPAPASQQLGMLSSHGTRVTVRDLSGNMPVRVKQRAMAAEVGVEHEKGWQELNRRIGALLLAWPKPCAVRIRDSQHPGRNLNITGNHPNVSMALTEKHLDRFLGKDVNYDLRDALPILFQIGLASNHSRNGWVPVSGSTSRLSIKGLINLEPAPTRQCQFVSIGIRPCSSATGHNEFYETINNLFNHSSFGTVEDESEIDDDEKSRRKRDRRFKSDGFTQKRIRGRKAIDKWPMFVLQIKLREHNNHSGVAEGTSEASTKAIIDVLEATITHWLTANQFCTRKHKKQTSRRESLRRIDSSNRQSEKGHDRVAESISLQTPIKRAVTTDCLSTLKRPRLTPEVEKYPVPSGSLSSDCRARLSFSSWSRIKSGRNEFYRNIWDGKKPVAAPAGQLGSATGPPEVSSTDKVFHLATIEAGEFSPTIPSIVQPCVNTSGSDSTSQISFDRPEDYEAVDDGDGTKDAEMAPHSNPTAPGLVPRNPMEQEAERDQAVDWVDPGTNQTFEVNLRTGVVLPSRPKEAYSPATTNALTERPKRHTAAIDTCKSSLGRSLLLSRRSDTFSTPRGDQWLPGFLKEWNNPVFAPRKEEQIPTASIDGRGLGVNDLAQRRCTGDDETGFSGASGLCATSKLTKGMLHGAKVVRQVDRKFILCKMQSAEDQGRDSVLVLVDQHAASERILVEELLSELCSPEIQPRCHHGIDGLLQSPVKTVMLQRPLHLEVSEREQQLFKRHSSRFADWGILYTVHLRSESRPTSRISVPKEGRILIVHALPPGIAERCTIAPKLLFELLRSEIWRIDDSRSEGINHPPPHRHNDGRGGKTHPWLSRIGTCPKGLIDLLNSRACRSAIMFNDELSVGDCELLLEQLSHCAFPFMCAHGRVSMVPVIRIGHGGDADTGGCGADCGENSGEAPREAPQFRQGCTAHPCHPSFNAAFKRWSIDDSA